MRHFQWLTAILLITPAGSFVEVPTFSTTYTLSHVAVIGTGVLDVHSSYGHLELNPLLRTNGRLGNKGAAISIGLTIGVVALQRVCDRKLKGKERLRARKLWTIGNFVLSGVRAGVAVRNYRKE